MEPDVSETGDFTVTVVMEEPFRRFHRTGIALLLLATITGVGSLFLSGDSLVFAFCTVFFLFLLLTGQIGRQKMLVLRSRDLYTIGAEIDQPIPWSSLDAIEVIGTGVELNLGNTRKQRLRLGFIDPINRDEAITRMIRYLELFRLYGPFRFPAPREIDIRSGQLRIRPVHYTDRDFCIALKTSDDSYKYQLAVTTSLEHEKDVFDATVAGIANGTLSTCWRLIILVDETPVGMAYLVLIDSILRHAQLGIDLLDEHQNQGYGTKAVTALLEYLRSDTNLIKVTAGCFSDNLRCHRMLEKSGFAQTGRSAKFWLKGEEWKSGDLFELDLTDSAPEGRNTAIS